MRQLCQECFSSPPAGLGPLAQRACLGLAASPEEAEQVGPGGAAPGPGGRESHRRGSERGAFGSAAFCCAETGRVGRSGRMGPARLGLTVREGEEGGRRQERPAAVRAPTQGLAQALGKMRGAMGLRRTAAAAVTKCAR